MAAGLRSSMRSPQTCACDAPELLNDILLTCDKPTFSFLRSILLLALELFLLLHLPSAVVAQLYHHLLVLLVGLLVHLPAFEAAGDAIL